MQIFSGLVWRHIPHGASALHVGWVLRAAGRWNRQGMYGCLYTALTPEGALAEYRKYIAGTHASRHIEMRDLVSVRVNRIGPVFDITNAEGRSEAGVDQHTLTGDEPDDLETCRTVADWARSGGYQVLLVPSSAQSGETNLIMYIDGPVRNVDLDEGPDRRIIEIERRD